MGDPFPRKHINMLIHLAALVLQSTTLICSPRALRGDGFWDFLLPFFFLFYFLHPSTHYLFATHRCFIRNNNSRIFYQEPLLPVLFIALLRHTMIHLTLFASLSRSWCCFQAVLKEANAHVQPVCPLKSHPAQPSVWAAAGHKRNESNRIIVFVYRAWWWCRRIKFRSQNWTHFSWFQTI